MDRPDFEEAGYVSDSEFQVAWMVVKSKLKDWPNCTEVIEFYIDGLKHQLEKDRGKENE